jgi:hypothetical protein
VKITIEVEPVLLMGTMGDRQYFAFHILGLPDRSGDRPLIVHSTSFSYPGNAAMQRFINQKLSEGGSK